MPRGQGGGHGPRAQTLEGAPAQLVGANFKSRAFKDPAFPALGGLSFLFLVEDLFFSFFFFLRVDFFLRAKGFVFTKGGAKGGGATRVGLWGC